VTTKRSRKGYALSQLSNLYPDDNRHHMRGGQGEAEWGRDDRERTEIWIFGKPREV